MRKSVYQMKYEDECEKSRKYLDQVMQRERENDELVKENNALSGIVSKEHAASEELRVRISRVVGEHNDLIDQRDQLKAKVQTLIATIHLLARAADGDTEQPIDPTF